MLRLRVGGVEFAVSFWFFVVLACFALADHGALLLYLLVPIVVHELGHLLVMALCRVRVRTVSFTVLGVDIRRESGAAIGYGRELAVSLGGVAANAALAAALHLWCFHSMRMMFLVASNIAVAIFNLMPIGDLDGGQVVKLLAARFFAPATARAVSQIASFLVLGVLFGFAIFLLMIRQVNPTLLVACGWLAVNVIFRE